MTDMNKIWEWQIYSDGKLAEKIKFTHAKAADQWKIRLRSEGHEVVLHLYNKWTKEDRII